MSIVLMPLFITIEVMLFMAIRLPADLASRAHENYSQWLNTQTNAMAVRRSSQGRAAGTPLGAMVMLGALQFMIVSELAETLLSVDQQLKVALTVLIISAILLIATFIINLVNRQIGLVFWIITLIVWLVPLILKLFIST